MQLFVFTFSPDTNILCDWLFSDLLDVSVPGEAADVAAAAAEAEDEGYQEPRPLQSTE